MEIVEIEATNLCNAACIHCPREALTRPMGKMSWEVFRRVADQALAHDGLQAVSFSGIGEPTLNPLLPRFIGYLSGKVATVLTTNASTLTDRKTDELLEAGLENIIISVNGHNEDLYGLMMGGLSFEKVGKRIQRFVEAAGHQVKVAANVSVSRHTEPHLADIRSYLADIGIQDVMFSQCHSRGGHLHAPAVCDTPPPPPSNGRCDIFASTLFVAWNGQALACCHDLAAQGVIGDLVAADLGDILRERNRILDQGVRFPICRGCNDMYRFDKDSLPGDTPLSEWLFDLYTKKDERAERLRAAMAEKDARIRELEGLVTAYERGRFIRLMRWLSELRHRIG